MTTNEKISQFLTEKGISYTDIAKERGTTPQSISQLLKKKKAALDFVLWLAERNPEIDLNLLLKPGRVSSIIAEPPVKYGQSGNVKQEILKEVEAVLDKYF